MKKPALILLVLILPLAGAGSLYLFAGNKTVVNIVVERPRADEAIGLPLVLAGKARTFENTVNYRVRDEDNSILLEDFLTAESADIGMFGAFHKEVFYPEPEGTSGVVEVFEYSAEDGSELHMVRIPIIFRSVEGETEEVLQP